MNFMQLRERQPKFPVTVKTGEGVVELIWNKIEYADGYRVFASPVGKNHFVGVINVKGTTAVMKKRANGVPMQYKVKAFRIADGPDNFFGGVKTGYCSLTRRINFCKTLILLIS